MRRRKRNLNALSVLILLLAVNAKDVELGAGKHYLEETEDGGRKQKSIRVMLLTC